MLNLNSLAASPCVISFFLVFFNATSRSLSTWVISSCPSCIPKAWGCQDDISTLLKDDILTLLPHVGLSTRRTVNARDLLRDIPCDKFQHIDSIQGELCEIRFRTLLAIHGDSAGAA